MKSELIAREPALEWMDGFPSGNGRIGFMLHGAAGHETFSLNADRLWRKNIRKSLNLAPIMPAIRIQTLEKCYEASVEMIAQALSGVPENCNSYQPFADLCVEYDNEPAEGLYTRSLDTQTGRVHVAHSKANLDAFTSFVDDMIVIRYIFTNEQNLRLRFTRERDEDCQWCARLDCSIYRFTAKLTEGILFTCECLVLTDGSVCADGESVKIESARRLELRICLFSDFDRTARSVPDAHASFEVLAQAQETAVREQTERASFELERDERDACELYNQILTGSVPEKIYERIYDYAKYLLISASQPGTLPMNLQGIWNDRCRPAWECSFTTDINLEMYYWSAGAMDRCECVMPVFDWIRENEAVMARECLEIFGVSEAIYLPQYTDAWMTPTCQRLYAPFQLLWSGGAAWLAHMMYEYWLYTDDDAFAREQAFVHHVRCANFYMKTAVKLPDGRFGFAPSANPENFSADGAQIVETATMDLALAHEIMRHTIELNNRLGLNDARADEWETFDKMLVDYPVDENGVLLEWRDSRKPGDPYHRHASHLYGLHPASVYDGEIKEAARQALDARLSLGPYRCVVWSLAWWACCYARLGDGERALDCLNHAVISGLMPNYLTAHNDWRPGTPYCNLMGAQIMQLDAVMGMAAAVCEMLIQNRPNAILLLPALPGAWAAGRVAGMRAHHGAIVDMEWSCGKLSHVKITALHGLRTTLMLPGNDRHELQLAPGEFYEKTWN